MKKYIIIALFVCVCWLGWQYHQALIQQQATLLVEEAYYGNLVGVKDAVEQGGRLDYVLNFTDPDRQYNNQTFDALQAAASGGNAKIILFLLEQQMNINSITPEGWTPLFIATRDGRADAAKVLVFSGADLNAQTNLGTTALTMVVTQDYPTEKERLDLLEYMLKRGADPNLTDVYNHTPLYYAQVKNNQAAVALLKQYVTKP